MKHYYIVYFLLVATFSNAQTKRFLYELTYKTSTYNDDFLTSTMVLDINSDVVKYYDYVFLEKDSVNQIYQSENTNWTDHIPIIRKLNSAKNLNFVSIDEIYCFETTDHLEWKLENETQKMGDFFVQKASLDFGGRKWTAWFTKDIPISEGPYKFQGLPGLILKISDSQNHFVFQFIQNKNLPFTYNTENILEVRYGQTPIKITKKQAYKKAKEYYENPLSDIIIGFQNGTIKGFEFNGKPYDKSQVHGLIKESQQDLLHYYYPIEIDQLLYPISLDQNKK